jgi:acetylornithine/LysW-gamma-L-lysine aminotransferase
MEDKDPLDLTEFEAIKALEDSYRSGVTPQREVAIVKAKGSVLWDTTGKQYLDLGASYGVCNIGHCHPKVIEAVKEQIEVLHYISPTIYNEKRAMLQERLISISPGDLRRVFLCNSGTEAVESALKFARAHTKRTRIIAAKRSFHGRTMGALSATFTKKYREPFEPLVPDFDFVTYGDLEELKGMVTDSTAAVILEPVQGEGGVHPAPEGYLKGVRDICDDKGALFIADEIQTGLGRTGRMFAVDHWDVVPDIMTVAKSLGGGLPIAAMVAKEEVCDIPAGAHGSTFSGSPICCAAALASLDVIIEENLPAKSMALGEYAMCRLAEIEEGSKVVREIRGLGLMIGIELKKKAGPYLNGLMERGVMALPAGATVIRFLPPLVITINQLDAALLILEEVFANV